VGGGADASGGGSMAPSRMHGVTQNRISPGPVFPHPECCLDSACVPLSAACSRFLLVARLRLIAAPRCLL